MTDIVKRLREPPFGTETSERNLMSAAAAEIEQLRAALQEIADDPTGVSLAQSEIAKEALKE